MISPEALAALGLFGVFVGAFLAGSIVAFPSEAAVVGAILTQTASPTVVVAVATCGNVLGAVTAFLIGRGAGMLSAGSVAGWLRRRIGTGKLERGHSWLKRAGGPVLLLSWVPIVGDALVLSAGALRVRWLPFLVFVSLGKGARYALVAWSTAAVSSAT